jgi:glucose-6-phosphate isomerase
MSKSDPILLKSKAIEALKTHQMEQKNQTMRDFFATDSSRISHFSCLYDDIFFDFSRNRMTSETISLLTQLAHSCQLTDKIDALFSGKAVNTTEKRPALHTALRDRNHTPIWVNGENIASLISSNLEKMRIFTEQIHEHHFKGEHNKPIKHIVNIGIGGSYLGPQMTIHALKEFAIADLDYHFITGIDQAYLNHVLQKIDIDASLFIISSKSFTTLETIINAQTIKDFVQSKLGNQALNQFVAITSKEEKAIQFGIPKEHIFPMWDWVGGRYSIWSAIGLPLMLLIGYQQFNEFLTGAYRIDQHFRQSHFEKNIPILMALISIWYSHFFDAQAEAVVPYGHALVHFTPYLQQAIMESNGKSVKLDGARIQLATSPVIFGGEGCHGQHAYHQLLHQGPHFIPVDFILPASIHPLHNAHHDALIASGLSQAQALMRGKTVAEAYDELKKASYDDETAKELAPHLAVPGNRPSNILLLKSINPKNLGALIALYEHKIFTQAAIWDINPFDQWGVELGKQLLPKILSQLQNKDHSNPETDGTIKQINLFKNS